MEVVANGTTHAVFDTSNIKVTKTEVDGKAGGVGNNATSSQRLFIDNDGSPCSGVGSPVAFKLLNKHDVFGTPLQVRLPPSLLAGNKIKVGREGGKDHHKHPSECICCCCFRSVRM